MHLRLATPEDATAMATIYNQGIEDRVATFETRLRTPQEIEQWFDGVHPIVVLETGEQQIIAFASTSVYRPRPCYAGIAEFSVYVECAWRGHGAGRRALEGLLQEAELAGFWKLVSRVFVENAASRAHRRLGSRPPGQVDPAGDRRVLNGRGRLVRCTCDAKCVRAG